MIRSSYAPHIDGLRAIAVVLVVLYHFGMPFFGGGFIGVDVFFVISGYLITRLIRQEVSLHGRLDFWAFYRRRWLRLYPALATVLLLSFVAGFLLMGPDHLIHLASSMAAASLGGANVYFWLTSGYFDVNADLKPLLHTWSLGVETQFYLVWPVLVAFLARRSSRLTLLAVLVVGAASLVASEFWLRDRAATYFLPHFRAYEFAMGALLTCLPADPDRGDRHRYDLLTLAGIGMIIWPAVTYSGTMRFPGIAALWSCIGAALIIFAGPSCRVCTILRNPLSAWIGRQSYAIYLIHWPALVFYKYYRFEEPSPLELVALLAGIIVASALLHHLVENRFRRADSTIARKTFLVPLQTVFVVLFAWTISSNGLDFRTGPIARAIPTGFDSCDYPVCYFGNEEQPDFVVIGDSHARHLFDGLAKLAGTNGLSFAVFHLDPYCRFLNIDTENEDRAYDCAARQAAVLDYVQRHQVRHALFAFRWRDVAGTRLHDERSVAARIDWLLAQDQMRSIMATGLVLNVPEFYENKTPQGCVVPPFLIPGGVRNCDSVREDTSFYGEVRSINAAVTKQLEGRDIELFDPFGALCDGARCLQRTEQGWLYSDSHHLSSLGAVRLVDHFYTQLTALLTG